MWIIAVNSGDCAVTFCEIKITELFRLHSWTIFCELVSRVFIRLFPPLYVYLISILNIFFLQRVTWSERQDSVVLDILFNAER